MRVTSATGSRGFTLLELLVVLTILVLMAGAWPFAAPRLFPAQQLRDDAQQFVADVRTTRLTARMSGSPQVITLNDTGSEYGSIAGHHRLSRGVVVHLRAEPSTRSAGRVMFFPDGSTSGGIIDFSLPSRMVSVALGPLTGRTEILE
jgi:general secretion pathway protein H